MKITKGEKKEISLILFLFFQSFFSSSFRCFHPALPRELVNFDGSTTALSLYACCSLSLSMCLCQHSVLLVLLLWSMFPSKFSPSHYHSRSCCRSWKSRRVWNALQHDRVDIISCCVTKQGSSSWHSMPICLSVCLSVCLRLQLRDQSEQELRPTYLNWIKFS